MDKDNTIKTMRSTDDGVTWTGYQSTNETSTWSSVAFGNNVFVAVASSGSKRAMRSTDDGVTWTGVATSDDASRGTNYAYPYLGWQSVAYGNGVFVAVANGKSKSTMRSTDYGLTWTGYASSDDTVAWSSVTYGADFGFVAVGLNPDERPAVSNKAMRSTDGGLTWTGSASGDKGMSWSSVAFGHGVFVAVGGTAYDETIFTTTAKCAIRSTDGGITWTEGSSVPIPQSMMQDVWSWSSVAYGNGLFVAVQQAGRDAPDMFMPDDPASTTANTTMVSKDFGVTWAQVTSAKDATNSAWASITYGINSFISVGAASMLTYPITWEMYESNGTMTHPNVF